MTPRPARPPLPIADFLDRLHAEGKRIVPGSLIWLPHPTRPGLMIAAVRVEEGKLPTAEAREFPEAGGYE